MTDTTADLDHEAIQRRYDAERDKRIRPDGNDQYLEPVGQFAYLVEDPYTRRVEREPLQEEVTVALIGAGFAGLVTGARLAEAGIDDVLLIDPAGDVGGVWYWNRYPGAMCDTAAMIYLPLLEETGYRPSMKYVFAPEIHAHAKRIAEQYGLYDHCLFSTRVTDVGWDETSSRWIIRTDRGDKIRARFVATGTGPLQRPKLPGIPGIETFAGHSFHTSRWDYDYTGGTPDGDPMTSLADKRVGIIGTGATAVQCIAPLARDSGELFVFQRTPSAIDVRNNHPIDPEEFEKLEPGWQREWLFNFATLQTGGFADVDYVKDGWTDISQRIRDRVIVEAMNAGGELTPEVLEKAYYDSDDEKMTEIRERVDALVEDRATAEALKPWYRQLCKRPCFHDEYLQAYNRPNCHLIDTDGQGVERIDATGVWVGGQHYELDCLIYASGFEFGTEQARQTGFDPVGVDGVRLSERWADGMRTMHGMHVHGFPNYFVLGMTQAANLISNITSNLVEAGTSVATIVSHAQEVGATRVEVTQDAEDDWIAQIMDGPGSIMLGNPDCTPGYYNNEGRPMGDKEKLTRSGYPGGPVGFFELIDRWRRSGRFEGLEIS